MNDNYSVMLLERVEVEPLNRPTLEGPEVSDEVFVEVKASHHVDHEHHFQDTEKSGFAHCQGCGANAWSEAWVAVDLYGPGTYKWAEDLYRAYVAMMQADAMQIRSLRTLAEQLTRKRQAARLNRDEPAKVTGNDTLFEIMSARAKARTVQPADPKRQGV